MSGRPTVSAREAIGLALEDDAAPGPGRPSWRARPIRSAGEYVAVVRRLHPEPCRRCAGAGPASWPPCYCGGTGVERRSVVDGRLIAPLWRTPAVPPREWGPGGRGQEWLAYWSATQPRPERVGSCYNDQPEDAARAWALGIPAERYPRGQAHLLPPSWCGGRRRIEAACRLARRRAPMLHPALRTAELRRLARLSGAFLRWLGWIPGGGRAVDWPRVAERHAEWLALQRDRPELQAARVPATSWGRLAPRERGAIRCLAAHDQLALGLGREIVAPRTYQPVEMPARRHRDDAGPFDSLAGGEVYAWGGRVGPLQRALVGRLDGIGRPGQVEWRWVEWAAAAAREEGRT